MAWPLWDEDCRKCHTGFDEPADEGQGSTRFHALAVHNADSASTASSAISRTRPASIAARTFWLPDGARAVRPLSHGIRTRRLKMRRFPALLLAAASLGRAGWRRRLSGRHARFPDRRRALLRGCHSSRTPEALAGAAIAPSRRSPRNKHLAVVLSGQKATRA